MEKKNRNRVQEFPQGIDHKRPGEDRDKKNWENQVRLDPWRLRERWYRWSRDWGVSDPERLDLLRRNEGRDGRFGEKRRN